MGYELDKLMGQYGVSTPTLSSAGATSPEDQSKLADYKAEYQNRMANTPMYGATQFNTATAQPKDIAGLYQTYLDRAPEAEGAAYWNNRFGPDLDRNEIAEFKKAASFENKAPTARYSAALAQPVAGPPTNINDLYRTYLDRAPDAEGTAFWGGRFGTDLSAQEIAEFKNAASRENNVTKAVPHYWGAALAQPAYGTSQAQPAYAMPQGQPAGTQPLPPASQLPPQPAYQPPVSQPPQFSGGEAGWDSRFADGGYVKTNFEDGGVNDLSGMADTYDVGPDSVTPGAAVQQLLMPPQIVPQLPQAEPQLPQAEPQLPQIVPQLPQAEPQPASGGRVMPPGLAEMMTKYQGEGVYGPELKLARETASRENQAFNQMLQDASAKKTDNTPSKAEMYFRLAAAFGAPTKTGGFAENMANVSKTLGEHAKETRDAEKAGGASRLALSLEAQRAKMAGAKEDLTGLRSLASEEMKDKRAIAAKMMEEYIKSGQPQSAAGKQAVDEGLPSGSPQFQKRVSQIAEQSIEKQNATITAMMAGMSAQQASANLAQQKFMFQQENAKKLTSPEIKLKVEAEDMVANTSQALGNLKRAYALNPNTFDASLVDKAQRLALGAAGSKDTKSQNTTEMENLLEKAALSQLKSTFPGAISNDERKALMDVQGLGAKSIEARGKIMRNAFTALQTVEERAKKRLNEINGGMYRDTGSSSGSIE